MDCNGENQKHIAATDNYENRYFPGRPIGVAPEKYIQWIPGCTEIADFMDIMNDECTSALEKIGGREVFDQVERLYPEQMIHARAAAGKNIRNAVF